ncbi:MAG: C40 family peptidase [Cyanobacteria bacterium RM1_2_2]|nr:C40 family peptidase [Cyanobacteria bacterium RM1_2_2]
MVSFTQMQTAKQGLEYLCLTNLNLYDSANLSSLATQAVAGRQLKVVVRITEPNPTAIQVQLSEDDYPGWLAIEDLDNLEVAETPYQPILVSQPEIYQRLPQIIAYTHRAMAQPNHYLWGGTVGPNYDCSGLMQTAFAAFGIWLPRDAYQQEAFVQPIEMELLQPGDLIFFGRPDRATHVGLYLGEQHYIHSSGKEQGRNGIGIDALSEQGGTVSQTYYRQLRGAGRVMKSYMPAALTRTD